MRRARYRTLRLLAATIGWAIGLLALSACGDAGRDASTDLAGSWEGRAGASLLVFRFRADGDASIAVTVDRQMSTTYCHWERLGQRISLTNARGQVRWFGIVEHTRDTLTLRLDAGAAGLCHFRRRSDG